MGPIHELAVLPIDLAVGDEHPQAFHHFTLDNHSGRVPVMVVPDVL